MWEELPADSYALQTFTLSLTHSLTHKIIFIPLSIPEKNYEQFMANLERAQPIIMLSILSKPTNNEQKNTAFVFASSRISIHLKFCFTESHLKFHVHS